MVDEFNPPGYPTSKTNESAGIPANPSVAVPTAGPDESPPLGNGASPDTMSTGSQIPVPTSPPQIGNSYTPPSSSQSSTHGSLPVTTLADSVPTSTSSMTPSTPSNNMTGFIAGIAVLGALFLVMTGILVWTIRRKRSGQHYIQPESSFPVASKDSLNPSLAGLENTIASLETQLHEKDAQLRERHVSMIAKGQSISRTQTVKRISVPDDEIQERFIQLRAAVSKWVSTYFGTSKFTATPIPDAIATLKKTFPQYASLIKENTKVTTILEGLVVDIISQSFTSGQLLGNEAFWELRQSITSTASTSEANEWRAMTMRLLERTSNYQSDRKEAVEDLSQTIDAACSELTKTRPKGERRASLEEMVDSAASLAIDMAKQRAMFKIERPSNSVFDPEMMEAWDVDTEAVAGAPIRAVVFPAVTKCTGESVAGSVWSNSLVIVKAKVLL